jgi:hypothetical protein
VARGNCICVRDPKVTIILLLLLQALAAGGAGLIEAPPPPTQQQPAAPGQRPQPPQQQHRGLQAKRIAALAARQQEALTAVVDAAALQLAPDHSWMQVRVCRETPVLGGFQIRHLSKGAQPGWETLRHTFRLPPQLPGSIDVPPDA